MISEDEKTVTIQMDRATAAIISSVLINALMHYEATSLDSAAFDIREQEIRDISNRYDKIRKVGEPK